MQKKAIYKNLVRQRCAQEQKFWLKISNSCNNQCIFCLDGDYHDGPSFNDFSLLCSSIHEAYKNGYRKLILSGGEATIHPDFLKLVSYAKKTGFNKIQVITNGRMFSYPDFAKMAVNHGLTETTFSIHSHIPEKHDMQTGVRGSFKQAVNGIINVLKTRKCIINIDVVVNRLNYDHVTDIIKFFSQMDIYEYDLLYPVPFGNAFKNSSRLFFSYNESKSCLSDAFSYTFKDDYYIWTNRFPAYFLEGYEELIQDPVKLHDEIAGRKNLFNDYYTYKKLTCMPDHCEHCFIKNFCKKFLFFAASIQNGFDGTTSLTIRQFDDMALQFINKTSKTTDLYIQCTDDNAFFYKNNSALFENRKIIFKNLTEDSFNLLKEISHTSANILFEITLLTCQVFEIINGENINSIILLNKQNCEFLIKHINDFDILKSTIMFKIPAYLSVEESRSQYKHSLKVLELYPHSTVIDCASCIHKQSFFSSENNINLDAVNSDCSINTNKLGDDFILNDYFVKSDRCRSCDASDQCRGMHINFIRVFGFKILKPVNSTCQK